MCQPRSEEREETGAPGELFLDAGCCWHRETKIGMPTARVRTDNTNNQTSPAELIMKRRIPVVPPPPPCLWDTYLDPASGHPYYTNRVTRESVWEYPESGRVASLCGGTKPDSAEVAHDQAFIHPRARSVAILQCSDISSSVTQRRPRTVGVSNANRIPPAADSLTWGAVSVVSGISGDRVTCPKTGDALAMHYTVCAQVYSSSAFCVYLAFY